MKLLKIGTLNMPRDRWEDALEVFDDIDIYCFDTEVEQKNDRFHYIKYNTGSKINFFLFRLARHFSYNKYKVPFFWLTIIVLRVLNLRQLRLLRKTKYDYIHSSYNDFDESAFLTLLLNPSNYTRAQKETRSYYSYLERYVFQKASRIVFNDKLNKDFFVNKYGLKVFSDKQIIYGLDEDYRGKRVAAMIRYSEKISDRDGRIHAVILASAVLSDPNDERSGGRLYYIPLIHKLLEAGFIVHLHTTRIDPINGKNPYEEMNRKEIDFIIEDRLDFLNDMIHAYSVLSRYDLGICHAHIPNSDVLEFDKVNIPHRYYEYHLAHVVPIDIKGGNLLLEKKAEEKHAIICNEYKDVKMDDIKQIEWDMPVFGEYIHALY